MSPAALLAGAAAGAGVLGTWEAIAATDASRLAGRVTIALQPLLRAGREGRAPSRPERRRLGLLAAACLLAAGWLLAGPAAGLLAALAAPVAVLGLARARATRYRNDLAGDAAAAARALGDSLGAGRSIRGALDEAARGMKGAAGRELRLVAGALAYGQPTEAALVRLRDRARSPGWDTIVTAILLQRDAGGDLAALLWDLSAALESAERAAAEARTATAQARFTARLVFGLPLGAAALAELASPGFLASLLAEPFSAMMSALAVLLQLGSLVAIRRIAR